GIGGLSIDPVPVHLDVHPVTCSLGVPTRHLDVAFGARAPDGARRVISHESDDLGFWPVDDLPPGFDESDRELIAAALARDRSATAGSGRTSPTARRRRGWRSAARSHRPPRIPACCSPAPAG